MVGEQVLDLARTDVLALADDDVLLAAGDPEIAIAVERAQVAGAEPAVGGEGLLVEGAIEVAEAALRSAREDLTLLPGRPLHAVVVDDPDLVGADHPALAVDATSRGIVGTGRGDRGKLRGAVDALGDAAESRRRLGDEGGVDVGAAAGEQAEARDVVCGRLDLSCQVAQER